MINRVKATYSNGTIVPLEQLDIEEGANLSISIEIEPNHKKPISTTEEQSLNQTLDALYIEDYFEKVRH